MASENFMDLALAQARTNKEMTEKQKKILETAIQMFAEKGFAATSTSEIAKASGVAEGTIFRHFGTKENLLLSVILPLLVDSALPVITEEFVDQVLTKSYSNFEDFLYTVIKNRLAFLEKNKEIFKILIVELLHRDDLRNQFISYFEQNVIKHLNQAFTLFKERGELIDLPNPTLIRLLLTFIFGYFLGRFAMLPHLKWDDPDEVENMVQYVLHGISKRN